MRLMRFIVLAAVAIFAFVAPFELALRLVPNAIPLSLLTEFEPTLRSAIAKQRKLQRFEDTVLVPRDDGQSARCLSARHVHTASTMQKGSSAM